MNKRQLEAMSTKQLVALLCRINDVLWRRFKPQEEYEYEGLETLTSACEELGDELVAA
jgi:hypothetical protein